MGNASASGRYLAAQAVHAGAHDRCGREHDDLPRAGCGGAAVEKTLRCRVMFSKRHPRARSWAYFASTDLTRSVVETLRGYGDPLDL